MGFLGGSGSEESACNTGDLGSIPGASQVVLVVKNPLTNAGDIRDEGSNPEVGKIPWKWA